MILSNAGKGILGGSAVALLSLYANGTLAGSATVESTNGERMVFEYADGDKLRLNLEQQNGHMIVRENTLYSVSYNNGEPMVINASTMMKGFADMAKITDQAAPSGASAEVVSIEATGRSETVAGISGEIYEITTLEEGREVIREVVMSSDARALEFRDAMFTMMMATAETMDPEILDNSKDFRRQLSDMNMGILRYGEEMTIVAIDGDSVAAARFELPAKPVDMNDLGGLMGAFGGASKQDGAGAGGTQSGGSGLFSSMMNKSDGEPASRAESADQAAPAAEEEPAEDLDPTEKAGRAVGKAFKKLFGD